MKKILFVQPESPDSIWKMSEVMSQLNKAHIPPLALATIAALTPEKYEIEIVDEEIQEIDFDTPCDLVGITGYTIHSEKMFEIAAEFRKRNILTVGGGSFCTAREEECKDHFDVLISGEAERTWPRFLSDWEQGCHSNYYREEEKIDLALSPVPRWDLVDLSRYESATVQTSRGCPYDCEFCDVVTLFGHRMRYKPLDNIMEEIRILEKSTDHTIFLADDNLIGNKGFVKELLARLIEFNQTLKKPLRYVTQMTLNVAKDEELLDLFKQANFYMVFIGIETPKKESLIETNKRFNFALNMKEAVRRIQSRGISIMSGLIVGFDSDDLDTFKLQSEFLKEAGLTIPMPNPLTALKGTRLWERLSREGRLHKDEKMDAPSQYTSNFVPKNMTRDEIAQNYLALFKEIYSYPHFTKSFRTLISQIDREQVKQDSPLTWRNRSRGKWKQFLEFFYVFYHFVIAGDRKNRAFYFSLLKIAWKKGVFGFLMMNDPLLFFIAENAFLRGLEERRALEQKLEHTFPSRSPAQSPA